MVTLKRFLTLIVLSSISQGLGHPAFATNIIGQPDFLSPAPPPSQGTIETSWGNIPGGSHSSYGNSGSSHTGSNSVEVSQTNQAPSMSQPNVANSSNSNSAPPTQSQSSPPIFAPLPDAPNPFISQNPGLQGNPLQEAVIGIFQAAALFDQFYSVTQVNKVNGIISSIENSLLDQSQFKARQEQLKSSSDADGLINDLEALNTELNSKSSQLDLINHETLTTFNDNQKSSNQQIRGMNQAGFDQYYKSYTQAAKYLVETSGWTRTSIGQLQDRKKHVSVDEREQRIQAAVDSATAEARNRLEQARQATNNRREEIREIQRIRANVNSSQIQQMHVERIVSEVNETLPLMTAQMEQAAGDYLREQLRSSQQLAQTGVDLASSGASESVVRIVSGFAVDTVTSIQSFATGLAGGTYHGFLTSAQVASAILSDPTLVTNLSVSIMHTISGGPGAVGDAVHNAFQHVTVAVYQFEVTMACGTATERGYALGEFGANVLLAVAGGEGVAGVRATIEGIATKITRSGAEALGTALDASLKASEVLAPEMAAIQAEVNKILESAASLGRELKGGVNFKLAPRVTEQLVDSRLGNIAGKLDEAKLNTLLNAPGAQRFLDANSGHINIIQQVEDKLLRITVTRDQFKVISVGPIRPSGLTNGIENARFIPLK
jgi:hypothetical protein